MTRTLAKVTMATNFLGGGEFRVTVTDNRQNPYRVLHIWHDDLGGKHQHTMCEYADYTSCLVYISTVASRYHL